MIFPQMDLSLEGSRSIHRLNRDLENHRMQYRFPFLLIKQAKPKEMKSTQNKLLSLKLPTITWLMNQEFDSNQKR